MRAELGYSPHYQGTNAVFLGYDGRTSAGPGALSLHDPGTGNPQTFIEVPGIAPNAMAIGPDSAWVLDYHGTLTRIALD